MRAGATISVSRPSVASSPHSGSGATPRREPNATRRAKAVLQGVAYANRAYREGGRAAVPGWRTDRGRIYARRRRRGRCVSPAAGGPGATLRGVELFQGQGAVLHLCRPDWRSEITVMIHSNDLKESGLPGWGDILGLPAVSDIRSILVRSGLTQRRARSLTTAAGWMAKPKGSTHCLSERGIEHAAFDCVVWSYSRPRSSCGLVPATPRQSFRGGETRIVADPSAVFLDQGESTFVSVDWWMTRVTSSPRTSRRRPPALALP